MTSGFEVMEEFRHRWFETVEKKESVLCAGLDPAKPEMERKDKGLPPGEDKFEWSKDYIEAVAPYCAAIKYNIQYWKDVGDMEDLVDLVKLAHKNDLLVIEDSKLVDIGSTNEAGVFYAAQKGADAVTFSQFAGNTEEAVQQGEKWGVALIGMCLMSNPQYKIQKDKQTPIRGTERLRYDKRDILTVGPPGLRSHYVKQYIHLAKEANDEGLAGIVIGAPSEKNHITETEISKVRSYVSDDMLVLLPGVGAQGGEADQIWKYFDKDNVIVNVGRSLMLPNGMLTTPEQQAETAIQYNETLNNLRFQRPPMMI